MDSDETDLHHLAGDSRDLHSVSHTQTILANEEEISHHGHDHILQRDRNSGGEQSGESDCRSQLGSKPQDDDHADRRPHDDSPEEQKLVPPPGITNVTEAGPAPDFSNRKYRRGENQEHAQPEQELA